MRGCLYRKSINSLQMLAHSSTSWSPRELSVRTISRTTLGVGIKYDQGQCEIASLKRSVPISSLIF